MSFLAHVECTGCGHRHDAKRLLTVCERCGQMLAARYDLTRVATHVTKEALQETMKEFRDLVGDRPIDAEEFDKAQKGMVRSFPPTFETPSQVLRRLLDIVHFGLPDDHFSSQVARIEAVTLADVNRVATAHVDPEALSIVIVGDRAKVEGPLSEVGLPIVHLDHEGEPE